FLLNWTLWVPYCFHPFNKVGDCQVTSASASVMNLCQPLNDPSVWIVPNHLLGLAVAVTTIVLRVLFVETS
ncbi:hypothetical protein, partial [Bacillus licheniformis]|uniref:hypothetical protein n=1 Tax=Bacillus licheniformis TaxID=1402 RepID=UPI00196A4458